MKIRTSTRSRPARGSRFGVLRFTPAEWRQLLEDAAFLRDADNSYAVPRRLIGLPVVIVPDHSFG